MNTKTQKTSVTFGRGAVLLSCLFVFAFFFFVTPANAYHDDYPYPGDYMNYDGYNSGYYGGYYDNSYYNSGYSGCCDYSGGYGYDSGYYDNNCCNYNYGGNCCDTGYIDYGGYNYNCCTQPPIVIPPVITPQPPAVVVSCSYSGGTVRIGDSVLWTAQASGGAGNFSYSWSGSDGLSGTGSSLYKTYSNSGTKYASVTVTSGGVQQTANCGSVFVLEQQNINPLSATCSVANYYNIPVGSSVVWNALATGGKGNYAYSWSGNDNLSGSGPTAFISYQTAGSKTGQVTITSGNETITRSCGTVNVISNNPPVVNPPQQNLAVSCYPSSTYANTNQNVLWSALASGGTGSYSYSWSGSDGLSSGGSTVSQSYYSPGTKFASVTLYSGGQSITQSCNSSVLVSSVLSYNYTPPPTYYPPVNYYNPPAPQPVVYAQPQQVASVYLSQIPYTGVGAWKLSLFLTALGLWSGYFAFKIIQRGARKEHEVFLERANRTDGVEAVLEEKARAKNFILSQDALEFVIAKAEKAGENAEALLDSVLARSAGESNVDTFVPLSKERVEFALN